MESRGLPSEIVEINVMMEEDRLRGDRRQRLATMGITYGSKDVAPEMALSALADLYLAWLRLRGRYGNNVV